MLTIKYRSEICGCREASTSTAIFYKCGGKTPRRVGALHPENRIKLLMKCHLALCLIEEQLMLCLSREGYKMSIMQRKKVVYVFCGPR